MKFIIGKKLDMTQKFTEDGKVVPVTRIVAGPCFVTAKNKYIDHKGIQIAWEKVDTKKVSKPQNVIFKKIFKKDVAYRRLKEFKVSNDDAMYDKLEVGQEINVGIFQVGDVVKIKGHSKGKGFQGVVKRHGFKGSPASHGHKDQLRMPGSIGATGPAHVFKGTRMGGHMGDQSATLPSVEIVEILPETNEIYIKGAVPGARNSLLYIKIEGDFELPKKEEVKSEEVKPVATEKKVEEVKSVEEKKSEPTPELTKEDVKIKEPKVDNKKDVLVKDSAKSEEVKE
ncbi:50S ribosomal protein L3 [Candidatus Falkowbacteria bacterium]|jgi:large subunit ribosomal protein L3|nr:50S ribosomal protein L3 [Candidatus Falkowbacteria bacterium]MBT5502987.1 50S ribosomal protein L3 [Candidatus Falkowbacteria bacterium]MBT6574343.1 50S ribosomal protein L3 [Candidatus Falkowbacteria bacterium]MBT7349064.1 50S ribosomal protein L3 [Candidatus Falkowbacteria bacterium]MBT7500942.1 50S ribosomal protein L3 [Candidatus Falkowbacteria bacterium]